MDSQVLTVGALLDKRVYVQHKKNEDTYRRIGKVRRFVFHPSEKRVIGFIVKRPDLALMFRRSDQFVAIDSIEVVDEGVIVDSSADATGARACRRLGVDWDKCLLWLGMEIVTESGQALGRVGDVRFHAGTGEVESIVRNEGATARLVLGTEYIPASMVLGFRFGVGSQIADYNDVVEADESPEEAEQRMNSGAIVVTDQVEELSAEGGLAERAGAATARATQRGKEAISKVRDQGAEAAARAKEAAAPKVEGLGEKAEEAIGKGAFATGRQIGRAKGMFSSFMDEYRKASRGEDGGE